MSRRVRVARDGAIATITLERADRRNALDLAGWAALGDAVLALEADEAVRCVVVRGAGSAFCAGADISRFPSERADGAQARAYGEVVERATGALDRCRHPTVAAIRGACTGGGLAVASACDLRIAGSSARLGVPTNAVGHALAPAEMGLIGRHVPPGLLLDMVLSGRLLDAGAALAAGLLQRVVPDEAVDAEVERLARTLAQGAPLAGRANKRLVRRFLAGRVDASDDDAAYATCDSADYREGIAAFRDKREPVFSGR